LHNIELFITFVLSISKTQNKMKIIKRILVAVVILLVGGISTVWFVAWRSPKYYAQDSDCNYQGSVLTMEQYSQKIDHPRPYIIQKAGKTGEVLFFGSTHFKDPDHPQVNMIEKSWKEFKPTVALVEGRLGFLLPGVMSPCEELW
jgi:hypothetical protein